MVIIGVKLPDGRTNTFNMKATDTIENVKAKIQEQGIETRCLIYDGKPQEDGKTLSDYVPVFEVMGGGSGAGGSGSGGAGDGGSGEQEEDEPDDGSSASGDEGDMQIFIKRIDTGKTIKVYVQEDDTIATVKAMIKAKEGIPRNQQRLIFADSDLVDCSILRDNNIQQESTLQLLIEGDGGGKRASSRSKKEEETSKDEVVDGLLDTIREKSSRVDVSGDVPLTQVANYMTQIAESSASALLKEMSREQLVRIHGMMDSTNGDAKTMVFQSIVFRDAMSALAKKGKTLTEMKSAMFDIMNLLLTREFGDETGKIQWKTTLKKKIDDIKGDMDREAGIAAERARAQREAEAARAAAAAADGGGAGPVPAAPGGADDGMGG